jgi:flavoprotein
MDKNANINIEGLQNLVNQIVASNLAGVIFARMETYKAEEPNKDYSLEAHYNVLLSQATKDVMNMYTVIWESLEAIINHANRSTEDTETDTSVSG